MRAAQGAEHDDVQPLVSTAVSRSQQIARPKHPARTSLDQSGPAWNSLRPSETSSLEQSDSNRFRPIQLSPKPPARTSSEPVQNQSGPAWNSLSRSETSSLEQSDSNRFRPIQLSPKHPARTSPDQSGPVRTGLEQLTPVRNIQSGTIRLKPVQNGWLRLHSSVRLPTAPRSRLRRHRRFRHERIRQAQPEQ